VDSIFQLLRLMQKLGSLISNSISRTSIFGFTTSSIHAKSKKPMMKWPQDQTILSIMYNRLGIANCDFRLNSRDSISNWSYHTICRCETFEHRLFCLSKRLNFTLSSISSYRRSSTMWFTSFYGTRRYEPRTDDQITIKTLHVKKNCQVTEVPCVPCQIKFSGRTKFQSFILISFSGHWFKFSTRLKWNLAKINLTAGKNFIDCGLLVFDYFYVT
jgi:hypothetical protein